MNSFSIDGEIKKTPQIFKSSKGTNILKFTIMQSKGYYQFVAFSNVADDIDKLNLGIGDIVSIESRIQPNNYTTKDGQKVYGYSFIVDKLNLEEKNKNVVEDNDLPINNNSYTNDYSNDLD